MVSANSKALVSRLVVTVLLMLWIGAQDANFGTLRNDMEADEHYA